MPATRRACPCAGSQLVVVVALLLVTWRAGAGIGGDAQPLHARGRALRAAEARGAWEQHDGPAAAVAAAGGGILAVSAAGGAIALAKQRHHQEQERQGLPQERQQQEGVVQPDGDDDDAPLVSHAAGSSGNGHRGSSAGRGRASRSRSRSRRRRALVEDVGGDAGGDGGGGAGGDGDGGAGELATDADGVGATADAFGRRERAGASGVGNGAELPPGLPPFPYNSTTSQVGCEAPPMINEENNIFGCLTILNACIDQGTIIHRDPRYHPWTSLARFPNFTVSELKWNLPSNSGIGDKWRAGKFRFEPPTIRPWHDAEESEDVRNPVYSNCTVPMVFYAFYPFNAAEVFRFGVNNLFFLQQRKPFIDTNITLLPMLPPQSRLPQYSRFWYQAFSRHEVMSLSSFSERRPPGAPSNATAEGSAARCFSRLLLCKLTLRKPTHVWFPAAQAVWEHYVPHAHARAEEFARRLEAAGLSREHQADEHVLKVVFAVRARSHQSYGRTLLNQDELMDRCNAQEAQPPEGAGSPWKSVRCIPHIFGDDNLYDLWLVRVMDVLVGVHGAAMTNGMFMRRGSSIVELRPYGFSGRESWPNIYMRAHTVRMEVHWYGIDVMARNLSTPGAFEANPSALYTRAPGAIARDRNLIVPWEAFQHQLLNIFTVGRSKERYRVLRLSHAYYITHDIKPLERRGKDQQHPMEVQTWFRNPDEERSRAMAVPLNATLASSPLGLWYLNVSTRLAASGNTSPGWQRRWSWLAQELAELGHKVQQAAGLGEAPTAATVEAAGTIGGAAANSTAAGGGVVPAAAATGAADGVAVANSTAAAGGAAAGNATDTAAAGAAGGVTGGATGAAGVGAGEAAAAALQEQQQQQQEAVGAAGAGATAVNTTSAAAAGTGAGLAVGVGAGAGVADTAAGQTWDAAAGAGGAFDGQILAGDGTVR